MSDLNQQILDELKKISKLLIVMVTKEQDQKDQIRTLDIVGFKPKEIAELIGITANSVRVTLHGIRKKNK